MIPKFWSGWGKIADLTNVQSWAILLLKMVRGLDEFNVKFQFMMSHFSQKFGHTHSALGAKPDF